MRTRLQRWLSAALSLGLLARAGPAFADVDKLQPFDQAIRDVYLDMIPSGQSSLHKPPEKPRPRTKDIVKTSERVFAASPGAAQDLRHLREFVAGQISGESADAAQSAPARDLLSPDDPGLAALVGISVFWHEAQRRYDRASDYRAGISRLGIELPIPVEMEQRGWEAGCRFWKAGIGVLLKPKSSEWPDSYYCENKFPEAYYCRLYFSVEIVILTASQLKASGRLRSQMIEDLSRQAALPGEGRGPVGSPFERVFSAYCGEYERSRKGNPLTLEGFRFEWGPGECLDQALKTVLDPAWKGSMDRCALEHPPGADIRAAAKDLRDWK